MSRKFIAHFIWTILAILFGICVSYLMLKGVTFAYGTISRNIETGDFPIIETLGTIAPPIIMTPPPLPIISIGFVGDIIPGVGVKASSTIFTEIFPYLQRPEIMIGNFEGVATNNVYEKCKVDQKNCYSFNGDNNFIKLIANASFDVLNVANNHFNDYGKIGQEKTLAEIKNAGMSPAGVKNKITYLIRNNKKVAILGFSNYYWTTDLNNIKKVAELVSTADQTADIVVVIFHGGGEGVKYSHTPIGVEWYLEENRGDLRLFAHSAIDSGADLVLGSGPHVLRGMEEYQGKIIAYSLGNFASANSSNNSELSKTSAILEVSLAAEGAFVSGTITPVEIDWSGIPRPDLNKKAITFINELSRSDFGENGIELDPSGAIILK